MTRSSDLGDDILPEPATEPVGGETACFIHERGAIVVTLLNDGTMRVGVIPNDPERDRITVELPPSEVDIVRIMLQRSTPTGVLNREKQS